MTEQKNASEGAALPCLFSHISNENPCNVNTGELQCNDKVFTTGRKRSAFILAESVDSMASKYGLATLGFLTLTFSDHVLCAREAQRRLNSLLTRIIKPRYTDYVGVLERQKSGRIHYHLLVSVGKDIRSGFDFKAVKQRDYRSANEHLRSEWAFWRNTARKYRFGRTELLPIRSSTQAIKFYVGKYISKSFYADVNNDDKNVRLVRYSRGARAGTTRFAFATKRSEMWREAVGFFAGLVSDFLRQELPDHVYGPPLEVPVNSVQDLSELLGPRWAYDHREFILGISEIFSTCREKGIVNFEEIMKDNIDFTSNLTEFFDVFEKSS